MSEWVVCKGQAEVDAAVAAGNWCIVKEGYVYAYGSATVRAYGSATVQAYDSATVQAYDSATVGAYDSATVEAYDSATVEAYDSATVQAYGSATVRAYGSATVQAYGSATVEAYGSATVQAYDSATVQASPFVAVHKHKTQWGVPKITGGVVIEVPPIENFKQWAEFHGLRFDKKQVVVFKAVDAELKSGKGFAYSVGEKVTAPDWSSARSCGNGLHFSQSPHHASRYFEAATRWLACAVPASAVLIDSGVRADKIKAKSCRVLYEVDRHGDRLEVVS